MEPQDLKDSIDVLISTIKQMPKGIMDMLRPPASGGSGMSASTLAGGLAGGGIAKIGGMFMGMVPQLRGFSREFGNLVGLLKDKNLLIAQSNRLGSSSPLGRAGLQDVLRSANNPFVSPRERQAIQSQVQDASFYGSRASRLGRAADQADEARRQAAENHQQSITSYRESITRKASADRSAKRAYDYRDAVQISYSRMLTAHQGNPQSPWGPHLAALRTRLANANKNAQKKARQARNAGAQVRAARANVAGMASASRGARASAFGARGAANTAQGVARQAAGRAGATAASANRMASYRATAAAIGSAASAALAFGGALIAAKKTVNDFVESTNHHNRRLSGWSAAIGIEFAKLGMGDVRRQFAMARGTEDTTVKLVKAIDRMRDNQLQMNISLSNLNNISSILGAGAIGGIDKAIGGFLKEIDRFAQNVLPENADQKVSNIAEFITEGMLNALTGFAPALLKLLNDWWNDNEPDDKPGMKMSPADKFIDEMAAGGARAGNGAPRAGRPRGFPNP